MSPEEWAFKISELIKEAEADGMIVESLDRMAILRVFAHPGNFDEIGPQGWADARSSGIEVDW